MPLQTARITEQQFDNFLALASDQPGLLGPDDDVHAQDWSRVLEHRNALNAARRDLRAGCAGRAMDDTERDTLGVITELLADAQAELDYRTEINDRSPRASASRGRQTDPGASDGAHAPLPRSGAGGTRSARGNSGGNSFGDRVVAGFKPHAEMFKHTGNVSFQIMAAATDPVTTAEVGTHINLPPAAPGAVVVGAQAVIPSRTVPSATSLVYPRYTSVSNAAGIQTEGSAKTAVKAAFTLITMAAATVAAYSKLTTQALDDSSELRTIADGVLRRAIGLALDIALVDGVGTFTGFEAIAGAVTSLVYTGIADAVSEEVANMQVAGFSPNAVVLNPATWLAAVTAKGTANDHYLSGNYLGPLPMAIRGLPVGLSPSVAAGKALVLDTAFCEYLLSNDLRITLGLDADDFTKNLVTVRAELRVIPVYRCVGAARLVTPKA